MFASVTYEFNRKQGFEITFWSFLEIREKLPLSFFDYAFWIDNFLFSKKNTRIRRSTNIKFCLLIRIKLNDLSEHLLPSNKLVWSFVVNLLQLANFQV